MKRPYALLATDVVDSTKLSEALGDAAMARLWAAHDRVARDLLPAHHGREIDKTDGFLMLFGSAADAVAYALAYHRALRALDPPIRARAGLHVGPVILTENAPDDVARGAKPLEVDGLAKPTAARVMNLAAGGQTLLTAAAKQDLGPTDLRVESHGFWRMKGLAEPVELFEVGDADALFAPPPDGAKVYRVVRSGELWLPVKEVRHNLPTERDAFVGRHADLVDLDRALGDGAHLVSIVGTGGSGKTRLVTRFAWAWLGDWPGGAWFCDLSEARTAEDITSAVGRALDIPLGKEDPVTHLGRALADRGPCLVILDNFEQVARFARETLGRWLDRAPEARFLVTTRESLGLSGETTLALAPLVERDAVDLFVARAQQARRDFVLADDDRPHVEALVRLLDALPLAVELAAARVRLMAPKVLVQRMSERFKLLASAGGRTARQATLKNTLDWSWDLLSADERSALAQLSVFEGGFTLEAAEAVLALSEIWPLDAVQALVDKSLVRRLSELRFDLLVSVQEYGAERLLASGEREATEARHGAWCATFGTEEAMTALRRHGGVERRAALFAELDNLVAACRRAVARSDGPVAVGTAVAAAQIYSRRGPPGAGVLLLQSARGVDGFPQADAARFERGLAHALDGAGRADEARARFEAELARAQAAGEAAAEHAARGALGQLLGVQGRLDEARALLEEGLAQARASGDPDALADALGKLGVIHVYAGRPHVARPLLEQALELIQRLGHREAEGNTLANLGVVAAAQERVAEARDLYTRSLAIHREVENRVSEVVVITQLGLLCADQGPVGAAGPALEAAVAVARDVGYRLQVLSAMAGLCNWNRRMGRYAQARALGEAAAALAHELGTSRVGPFNLCYLAMILESEGDEAGARARVAEAWSSALSPGSEFMGSLCLARLDRSGGRLDAALEYVHRALRAAGSLRAPQRVEAACELALVHLARGETAPGREALERARTHAGESASALRHVRSLLAATEALVAHAEGDAAGAARALADAVDDPEVVCPGDPGPRLVAFARERLRSG